MLFNFYMMKVMEIIFTRLKKWLRLKEKYHGKRNHITNFKKNNPNWSFETINKDNIDDCINLHAKWINTHVDDSDISFEFEAVLKAFENYDKLGFVGGIIRIDGEAVAYTFGEPISDETFVTHFEKPRRIFRCLSNY